MASGLRDALPVTGSGNYLYVLLMEEADSDIHKFPFSRQPPQGPHSGFDILTRNPLPHQQVPWYIHMYIQWVYFLVYATYIPFV